MMSWAPYLGYINPRPAGPLDFPPPAGGGGGAFERPPMISAPEANIINKKHDSVQK